MPAALTPEPGTPPWVARLVAQMNRALSDGAAGRSPVKIPEVANAAGLPSPGDYRSCLVFVTSIARVAVSDGTHWLRTDNGAAL